MFKKIYSWFKGRKIGERSWTKDNPYIIGDLCHFLPTECQTQNERNSLKYRLKEWEWNGYSWKLNEYLELTSEQAKTRWKLNNMSEHT